MMEWQRSLAVLASCAGVWVGVSLAVVPVPALAQAVPGVGGGELRAGLVSAEGSAIGPGIMAEFDAGYFWRPELRIITGLSRFSANIDREPGDDEGSYRATGFWLGARYDLLPLRSLSGYARLSLTVQSVDADAWDSDVQALLSGTNVGAGVAIGARRTLDASGRFSATAEVRRTAINNMANTSFELGVRYLTRGTNAYVSGPVALTAGRGTTRTRPDPSSPVTPAAPAPQPAPTERVAEAPSDTAGQGAAAAAQQGALAEQRARQQAMREQEQRAASAAAAAAAAERAAASESMLRQGLNRAAAAMAVVSSVRETDSDFILTLGGGAFASGAAALGAGPRTELRVLATVLAGYPGHIIRVEGHTDAVGDPAANVALSRERAAAVRAALIVEGVDPLWTGATGFGAVRPVATNDTAAGRAANRRVEILVARRPCTAPPRTAADGSLACP